MSNATSSSHPLLAQWTGPCGGVPAFDQVHVGEFKPALEAALARHREELKVIAENPTPPTFENTIAAMERAGEWMRRVRAPYHVWSSSMRTPEFQRVEEEMVLQLAAFTDEVFQNEKLFRRIEAVYNSPALKSLSPEAQRLAWLNHNEFVLQGARLNGAEKTRVAQINQRLAALMTQFSQNVLSDEENQYLLVKNKGDLAGLPQALIDGAATEAVRRGFKGQWVFANTRSMIEPFLSSAKNRALREEAFRIWTSRGDHRGPTDNGPIVQEILKLRTERSKLLGFATFAHWRLADTMAADPKPTMDLMLKVWRPAVARARLEVAEMQALVDREGGQFKIQPWDYRFYAEQVCREQFDLDMDAVTPYLQLEKIREAMFWMAGELYGLSFARVSDVPVYHPDVSVYRVTGQAGKNVGLWYFDPYARPGKLSGAWMSNFREQGKLDGEVLPLVSNNSNFIPGAPGEPVTISWADAVTMFHEFGHALHSLLSNVTYIGRNESNATYILT